MSDDYSIERTRKYTLKLREVLKELPPACSEFFRGIEQTTSILTRYGYALDLRLFLKFLLGTELCEGAEKIGSIDYKILGAVTAEHIERFLEYIALYPDESDPNEEDPELISNGERGKARKLSSIRAFYKYLYKKGRISANPAALVDAPKLHERSIIRLEPDEVAKLLDLIDSGAGLTDAQKRFHNQTKVRDAAIVTLFLGTGMRISELVGLNMDDVDFMQNEVRIVRKGGNQDVLVFGSEVRRALLDYMLRREGIRAEEGHEKALFLSLQNKRITVRAVEQLVKKYAKLAAPLKKISPHKLRSTYGTTLYRETGDIYLVADVLGHMDVNTTRKHYAAISQDRRRTAAEVVKLRDAEAEKLNDYTDGIDEIKADVLSDTGSEAEDIRNDE
ncbi:MAG: tyrosine-type recombinase/integrase [Clostridia bacterium]|nr:tyrosine-type recombinase/integrase [Clostridia bacterium]